ncbi:MAG: hypothetical protein K5924_06015 [Chloroflexi bacterium]|nr:hypothetical protein [Chloroflexota bacterium]
MRRIVAFLVLGILAVGLVAAVFLGGSIDAPSGVDPDVTVRCPRALSVDACTTWGDRIIEDGPPSTTFEMQDVVRVELARGPFGWVGACEVRYFLGRYPDDAVWHEEVACPA